MKGRERKLCDWRQPLTQYTTSFTAGGFVELVQSVNSRMPNQNTLPVSCRVRNVAECAYGKLLTGNEEPNNIYVKS